jgi:hypothetical protein
MTHVRHEHRLIVAVVLLVIAAMAMSACGSSPSDESDGAEAATVKPLKGTDLSSVTLTKQAAERLGIRTATVRQHGARRKVIPYGAILYNADGSTFIYTSPKPLVYVRAPISVERIDGPEAILSAGPPVDTNVVTVGSQELYGSEYEVEED